LLEYSVDPPIPGIAGQNSSAVRLLEALGIEFQKDGSELTWNEITEAERRRIISFIVTSMIAEGISAEIINQIIGETYVLNSEKGVLKDLKEFATLLNACGRYGEFSTAMRLCIQDRHEALQEALTLLENHRKNISAALRMIREEGMKQGEHLQYFHALDRMPDTIVGTVAGILMKSGEVDSRKVIVGFASSEGKIKVSARGNEELIQKGLDLSSAIRDAAASVGGVGGGHMIAAGATIDAGREEDFIKKLDECLRKQLLSG
jgi:Single-stranded DNA-specific exonuclease